MAQEYGEGIKVSLNEGRIIISLDIKTLAFCANEHPLFFVDPVKVTDAQVFAEEIVRVLKEEQEDGSTILTNLFDDAIVMAVEDGCEGIV